MNSSTKSFILLIVLFCFFGCASKKDYDNPLSISRPPKFNDQGKTIDSLKLAYHCEKVEFENWEEDDTKDSCLTICLINSNKVPTRDDNSKIFRGIASAIKKSLTRQEDYNSYYIIFVSINIDGPFTSASHSNGTKLRSIDL